jgi:hypothetical protein
MAAAEVEAEERAEEAWVKVKAAEAAVAVAEEAFAKATSDAPSDE